MMQGKDGRPVLFIGLSSENVARIVAGEPILFDSKIIGFDPGFKVVITYGKMEKDIVEEIKSFSGGQRVQLHITGESG